MIDLDRSPERGAAQGAGAGSGLAELVVSPATADAPPTIDFVSARANLVRSDPQRPLYRQLADMLRKIEAPEQGVRLPTERQLAQGLSMARVTVRKALAALERDGILRRRQGVGTYRVNNGACRLRGR